MADFPLWLPAAFFLIALSYSIVGFGGGSSYLAILILAGFSYQHIPAQALICNIIVAGGGLWHFYKAGHLKRDKVLPFIILSVPMAYLGGRITIDKDLFCALLGGSLFVVALRLFIPDPKEKAVSGLEPLKAWGFGLPVGGVLGFLAGIVGIGGGIFLSPILLLLKWATAKEAAACAATFIVVNSIAGLLGQMQKGATEFTSLLPLAIAVLIGGQIGSRLGAYQLPRIVLQRGVAILVLYVSAKLIMETL